MPIEGQTLEYVRPKDEVLGKSLLYEATQSLTRLIVEYVKSIGLPFARYYVSVMSSLYRSSLTILPFHLDWHVLRVAALGRRLGGDGEIQHRR